MLSSRQPALNGDGTFATTWFQFFSNVDTLLGNVPSSGATPDTSEQPVSLAASPATFTASVNGAMLISGGAVSDISITRSNTYSTGMTSGMIPLMKGDVLTVTYTAAPTAVFFPT